MPPAPSRPFLPSTRPERHTEFHCFLICWSYAALEFANDDARFYFLVRERL